MNRCVLITGAAKRIGANIAQCLHQAGFNITLHFNTSQTQVDALVHQLNKIRTNSALAIKADLTNHNERTQLVTQHLQHWQRMDVLINNASIFYGTPFKTSTLQDWHTFMTANAEAPYFLSQLCADTLQSTQGCIINIVDIYANHPLKNYPLYSMSKATLVAMTKSLALELAPHIRVNAVAPGNILWPSGHTVDAQTKEHSILQIPLQRQGSPVDIANTVLFLIDQTYMTGQIINVDGGKGM